MRQRMIRCGKERCTACPHGPYFWIVWKSEGKQHEHYLGRTPEGAVWMLSPVTVMPTPPKIGSIAALRPDTLWGVDNGGGNPVWNSVVSTFRVDGTGIGKIGEDLSVWVSLRTIDGRRVYQKVGGSVSEKESRWGVGLFDPEKTEFSPWTSA